MAKSKYEYVREFESATDPKLLPDSYVVVRVDGQCFHRFATEHQFLKPNDKRCLDLMNKSALHVMRTFYPNIILAYGQSDEYSFIIRRLAQFFNRRSNKITSLITSAFTSAFVYYWPQFFNATENRSLIFRQVGDWKGLEGTSMLSKWTSPTWNTIPLKYPPAFDGRCVLYPSERTLTDYLRWRQVDCHINNLYNTTFYSLTGEYTRYIEVPSSPGLHNLFPLSPDPSKTFYNHGQATQKLSGSSSGDKNEIMFTDYSVNYNNELEQFRKGTVLVLTPPEGSAKLEETLPSPGGSSSKSKATQKRIAAFEEEFGKLQLEQQEQFFTKLHCDIIGEAFWSKYGHLLKL